MHCNFHTGLLKSLNFQTTACSLTGEGHKNDTFLYAYDNVDNSWRPVNNFYIKNDDRQTPTSFVIHRL